MVKRNQSLLTYLHQRLASGQRQEFIQRRRFTKGQYLIEQDEQPQQVYILTRGVVKCFITEENGRSYVLEFLGEGEIVGELEGLLESTNLSTIEALTEVEAYQISQDLFRNELVTDPAFNQLLLQELALRLSRTARRASYQQIFPMEYAVLHVLFLFGESGLPISKQDLADYVAVPLRSLNRVLKSLAAQNLFTTFTTGQLIASPEKLLELMRSYY